MGKRGLTLIDSRVYLRPIDVFKLLQINGIAVTDIFDIGAHKGSWSLDLSSRCDESVNFYLFEPNPRLLEDLNCDNFMVFELALGSKEGPRDFFAIRGTGDSFYKESSSAYSSVRSRRVHVKTLDKVVEEFGLPNPQLIKIDCQGAELDILKGAKKTLTNVKALIIEVQLLQSNLGAPRIETVFDFLEKQSFRPIAITEIHNRNNVLDQIDFVFVSKSIFNIALK